MAEPDKKPENVETTEEVEEVVIEEEHGSGDAGKGKALTDALMQNPELLAAVQSRLTDMVGQPSGYDARRDYENLPKVVKRRIKALKKLQFEMIKIESKFYEEVHELECKYAEKYAPLYERRKEVVTAGVEPTDSDCDWPSDDEETDEDKLAAELKDKVKVEEEKETKEAESTEAPKEEKEEENPSGVPNFWLTIFKNVDMLSEMVQDHDEPILQHLQDIKVKFSQANPMGFKLEFYFESNEYFTNTMLIKEYILRAEPEEGDPFSYEGPEIVKCTGCTIDWQKGKNVTVKLIKKTQKHKGRGTKRTVTKTVQNDSFFNFFSPPEIAEGEEADEDTEALLAADFEIGHFIRERIVPRAVLYFTGEALDEDEFEEEGEEEEDENEEGDYDEEHDPDFNPQGAQKPAECKQQ